MALSGLFIILAVMLTLLFLGVPISYGIGIASLSAILTCIDLDVAVLTAAQRTFVGMSKFSLTAIPFFILAGNNRYLPREEAIDQYTYEGNTRFYTREAADVMVQNYIEMLGIVK